jgi:outer membrane protein assembly factor BamC
MPPAAGSRSRHSAAQVRGPFSSAAAVGVKLVPLLAAETKQERAKLTRAADGAGDLSVFEPFDRAWRRVGLALDRVGFTVEDRDRSQGLYFVRYIDPEVDNSKKDGGEKGWLAKLNPMSLFKGKAEVDTKQQYRIHVVGEGEETKIRILTREGGVDKSETSRKILSLLHEQLK